MRVIVSGGIKNPILLKTTAATAILIETDDGKPNVLFKILPSGEGWLRLVKGEDAEFDSTIKKLGLTK
jgi:hypothetical protein